MLEGPGFNLSMLLEKKERLRERREGRSKKQREGKKDGRKKGNKGEVQPLSVRTVSAHILCAAMILWL